VLMVDGIRIFLALGMVWLRLHKFVRRDWLVRLVGWRVYRSVSSFCVD